MIKIRINYQINIDKWEKEFYNEINRSNIKIFTYKDYLRYQKFINERVEKDKDKLNEEDTVYIIGNSKEEKKKINNEDDKVCRKMLDIKIEAAHFINKKLNINLKPEQLEKYNSSFVTNNLENRESDIIYKIKGRNIFFLIEHQTKKDPSMPWRMTEYAVEIIKSAIDYNKIEQKDYKLPLVIPIVIYTGKTKWNIREDLEEIQEKIEGYKELGFGKYIVDDVNSYTEEELLKEKTYLSKFMMIEKYKKGSNLSDCLDKIVKEVSNKDNGYKGKGKEVLLIMIDKVLKEKIKFGKTEEIIKELRGDEGEMLQVLETIREENEDLRREGRQEGRREGRMIGKQEERLNIIKEMLKEKMSLKLISKITGVSIKEINKINND